MKRANKKGVARYLRMANGTPFPSSACHSVPAAPLFPTRTRQMKLEISAADELTNAAEESGRSPSVDARDELKISI